MARVRNAEIKEKIDVMNNAWLEGAPSVKFNGIGQEQFNEQIVAAAATDAEIDDIEARLKIKRDERDNLYFALGEQRSKIGLSVAGDPNYGNDSPLYGAMGFVRKSERKSGLTRKKKTP